MKGSGASRRQRGCLEIQGTLWCAWKVLFLKFHKWFLTASAGWQRTAAGLCTPKSMIVAPSTYSGTLLRLYKLQDPHINRGDDNHIVPWCSGEGCMNCSMESLRTKPGTKPHSVTGKTVFAVACQVRIRNNASFKGGISHRKPQPLPCSGPFWSIPSINECPVVNI